MAAEAVTSGATGILWYDHQDHPGPVTRDTLVLFKGRNRGNSTSGVALQVPDHLRRPFAHHASVRGLWISLLLQQDSMHSASWHADAYATPGSRTPMYMLHDADVRRIAYAAHGSMTPSHSEDGSRTPGAGPAPGTRTISNTPYRPGSSTITTLTIYVEPELQPRDAITGSAGVPERPYIPAGGSVYNPRTTPLSALPVSSAYQGQPPPPE